MPSRITQPPKQPEQSQAMPCGKDLLTDLLAAELAVQSKTLRGSKSEGGHAKEDLPSAVEQQLAAMGRRLPRAQHAPRSQPPCAQPSLPASGHLADHTTDTAVVTYPQQDGVAQRGVAQASLDLKQQHQPKPAHLGVDVAAPAARHSLSKSIEAAANPSQHQQSQSTENAATKNATTSDEPAVLPQVATMRQGIPPASPSEIGAGTGVFAKRSRGSRGAAAAASGEPGGLSFFMQLQQGGRRDDSGPSCSSSSPSSCFDHPMIGQVLSPFVWLPG